MPSRDLADLLHQHDVYITASLHEARSNAVMMHSRVACR